MRNSESSSSARLRRGVQSLEMAGPASVEPGPDRLAQDQSELDLGATARRALISTLVAIAAIVVTLALWKLKLVISLFFLAVIIASAMRPGVEALRRRGIPRGVGVLIHYLGILALVALFLWLAVPRALTQVEATVRNVPTSTAELKQSANHSSGVKHQILVGIQKRLKGVPSGHGLFHPALSVTTKAFEALLGVFFVFACAAYWIFERDRTVDLVTSLIPRPKRKTVRDTWDLIDARLGAFVRGELLLIIFVATLLSLVFWLIGEPYWVLLGILAGVLEVVPVIGPLLAGAVAVGVGLTVSWHVALAAGLAVLIVRAARGLPHRAARARPRRRPLPAPSPRVRVRGWDPLRRLRRPARNSDCRRSRDARRRRCPRQGPSRRGRTQGPLPSPGRRGSNRLWLTHDGRTTPSHAPEHSGTS